MLELGQKNIEGSYDSFGEFFEGKSVVPQHVASFEALP